MKIVYVANARLPTERAHGLQIMQMCDAFARAGHEVALVVPDRQNPITATPWEYYGLEPCFMIVRVPIFDFIPYDRRLGNAALWLSTLWFVCGRAAALDASSPTSYIHAMRYLRRSLPAEYPSSSKRTISLRIRAGIVGCGAVARASSR
jgi:hypothetical protein